MTIRVNDEVFCVKGLKSGWGIVKGQTQDGLLYEVEFPDAPYPASEYAIVGTYFIPKGHITNYRRPRVEANSTEGRESSSETATTERTESVLDATPVEPRAEQDS